MKPQVIADASPVRYLVSIGQIDLLRQLFERVIVPVAVAQELRHSSAPVIVQAWMEDTPDWFQVMATEDIEDPILSELDSGEKAAIALALRLRADLLLIDDRKGAAAAALKGLGVTGTIGVLNLAAERGLVDLIRAFDLLKQTNFRYRQELLNALIRKHGGDDSP